MSNNISHIFLLTLLTLLNLTEHIGRLKNRIPIGIPPTNIRNLAVALNVDYSEDSNNFAPLFSQPMTTLNI
jgi:hypothetical protein